MTVLERDILLFGFLAYVAASIRDCVAYFKARKTQFSNPIDRQFYEMKYGLTAFLENPVTAFTARRGLAWEFFSANKASIMMLALLFAHILRIDSFASTKPA